MHVDILTLFPGMFAGPLEESILKRAQESGLLSINLHDIRAFAEGKHRITDDYPYGGGSGMVMKPEPVAAALDFVLAQAPKPPPVLLMCPQGRLFTQEIAKELAREEHLVFLCGHYEGIDERIRELVTDELSIGDFVLTGGELPAMVIVDAVARMIPGVLGAPDSAREDSFFEGLLDYPQYTRPPEFHGSRVPEVLLSGHHEMIRRWRRKESLRRTLLRRPDLLALAPLTDEDHRLLAEIRQEEEPGKRERPFDE